MEPGSFADVERAIVRELGAPIEALFAEFEPEARAAASLAQVGRLPTHRLAFPVALKGRSTGMLSRPHALFEYGSARVRLGPQWPILAA